MSDACSIGDSADAKYLLITMVVVAMLCVLCFTKYVSSSISK